MKIQKRLREAHPNSTQYALGSNILLEAAERIEELEAMLIKKRDLIRCGIAANYSGNSYENELLTEVQDLLNAQ